jgi:hypothetical protein
MNLNQNPTVEKLRDLLAREDDRAGNHVLWVNRAGDVVLTRLPRARLEARISWEIPVLPSPQLSPLEVRLYCEPFQAGYGYVGEEAARDEPWLEGLLRVLLWAGIRRATVRFLSGSTWKRFSIPTIPRR